MKRKLLCMILLLTLCVSSALAEALQPYSYTWKGDKVTTSYTSDTLKYTVEKSRQSRTCVYVTKVWMEDPGSQICKAMAPWREGLEGPKEMMKRMPSCVLAINGSGYISSTFPTLEEGYPGESPDYYFTSLGSICITDGEIYRRMDEVPFYGLTLEADGLHMWNGVDNSIVMQGNPTQTWCFWHKCTLIEDGVDVLDRENWSFANASAARTIIAKVDRNNYLLMTVARDSGSNHGMKLTECVDFLMANFQLEWAYNLDGGPSSALLYRKVPGGRYIKAVFGAERRDFDLLGFTE